MNAAQIHLALNHVPVIALLTCALFFVWGNYRKDAAIKRAASFGFIIVALLAIPTFLSGDKAAELVKDAPGAARDLIHDHEETGEVLFIGLEILGVLAAASLFLERKKKPQPRLVSTLLIVLSVTLSVVGLITAKLGGQIRHSEIRLQSTK